MKIKALIPFIIIGFVLALAFHFIASADIDAPHNQSNEMGCGSCHGEGLLKAYWGGSGLYSTSDELCFTKCHWESSCGVQYPPTSGPEEELHMDSDDNVVAGCVDCHNPHEQGQKQYKNTDASNLYLAKGTITGCVYNGDVTSTLTYSSIEYKTETGWDASKLIEKSGDCRQAILFPNTKKLGFSYTIIGIDEGAKTITVEGDATVAYQYVSPPTEFAVLYGQLIRESIRGSQVKFFDKRGQNSFAFDESLTGIDPTPDGVCQVCHTDEANPDNPTHWRADGTGADHYNNDSITCTYCHNHTKGYLHGGGGGEGCGDCHNSGNHVPHLDSEIECADCHDLNNMPGFKDGLDLANTTVCAECHKNGAGGDPNQTDYKTEWGNEAYDLDCTGCHSKPPDYANGNPKANSHAAHNNYTCNNCHYDTTTDGDTITNLANHINNAYDVSPEGPISFTYTYDSEGGTCETISCHGDTDAQWGVPACLNCHSVSRGDRAAITGQFSANSHHVQGVDLTSAHCYVCHWEANSDGTINYTYHGGSEAPGSVVNLVIYGIGPRPTTYTVGTTAIQYTANGTRTEINKLNSHCLGCHNTRSTTQTTNTDFRAGSFSQATLNGITGPEASVQLAIGISAGTGAEGAYSCSSGTCTIASGTHNYTTFSVSPGATVTFSGTNPVIINATFGVTVDGLIRLNGGNGGAGSSGHIGSSGAAGVGGSAGGTNNTNGSGSGGGGAGLQYGGGGGGAGYGGVGGNGGRSSYNESGGAGGSANSDAGGSGGGSGRSDPGLNYFGGGGGGGGGSFKMVSASQIIVVGSIRAIGGAGGSAYDYFYSGGGGGGSGGSITLIGSTITNSSTIIASGGAGGRGGPNGGGGGGGAGGRISIQTVNGTISGNAPIANGGAGGNGAYNGSPGASSAPTYSTVPYNSSGTFVSGPVDAGINPDAWTSITWHTTQTATTQITLKAKSYSSEQTPNFAGCDTLATITSANANSSASLSGYSCVNPTDRYIYYQATLSGDTTASPLLDDVTINYDASSQQTSLFGDGKSPNQYAWDTTSIGDRYSQTGTTWWGKYSGGNTTPKNTQIKAYSAHGNAVNNQGGWNLSETWPNKRNGTENIACFDCHNSHGSSVSGVTTTYTSDYINAPPNGGGILKDTVASKGGYSMSYKPQEGGSTDTHNAYNAGAGLCFDCHLTAASGTTPWGYTSTFGATQAISGYRDTPYFGPAAANPHQRFGYKASNALKGGHFGASSVLGSTPTGTINGLCTPCHDPHGVSPALGNRQYSLPLLKGTWLTSPYKEDRAPQYDVIGTIRTDKNREGIHYYIDQNTFGSDINSSVTGITETDTQFAGLCLNCHSKNSLTDGTTHTWKSKDRVHESVKGWKTTPGHAVQHNYPCSKCHAPHNAGLPRLMITNCLESRHKGFKANNPAPNIEGSGSGYDHVMGSNEVYCGTQSCVTWPGSGDINCSTELGYCPPWYFTYGCGNGDYTGGGSGRTPGYYFGGCNPGHDDPIYFDHAVTCHENYDSNQYWNVKTPWSSVTSFIPPLIDEPNIIGTVPLSVTLNWDAVTSPDGDPVQYYVQADDNVNFDSPVTSAWLSGNSWTISIPTAGTWYWRVQARDANHTSVVSDWSITDSFSISQTPPAPILIPEPDTNYPTTYLLQWYDVTGGPEGDPVQYYVQMNDASDFSGSNNYTSGWISGTSWSVTPIISVQRWYWRVQVRNANHTSAVSPWSIVDSFITY